MGSSYLKNIIAKNKNDKDMMIVNMLSKLKNRAIIEKNYKKKIFFQNPMQTFLMILPIRLKT